MNKRTTTLLSMLVTVAGTLLAQGYYDDDIYFDASKDKDKNIEQAKAEAKKQAARRKAANGYILRPVEYAAADTYAPEGSSTRSVDEYNRRGIFASDTLRRDTTAAAMGADFAATRSIERFYNPAVVAGSSDSELATLYYAEPANITISVTPGYPWGSPWSWGYYDPWWGPTYYGPSWGWGGYWGPNYWVPSWAWGPGYWGPSWAWGPGYWGPGWGWSWGWGSGSRPVSNRHPGAIRHPSGSGAMRPGSTYRPGNRPGRYHNSAGYRPAYRPSGSGSVSRPANNGSNNNSGSYTRPGRNSGSSYNSNSGSFNRHSSGGSYRGNSGGSTRGSGGGGRGRH